MLSYPTPETAVRPEPMSERFTKFHLPHDQLLHRFTAGPADEYPHNHPFSFTTRILSGGYCEEVYTWQPDGRFTLERHVRHPGTSHHVPAGTVHRLLYLLTPECWTNVEAGPTERESGFYRFDEAGVWYRPWHQPDFALQVPRFHPAFTLAAAPLAATVPGFPWRIGSPSGPPCRIVGQERAGCVAIETPAGTRLEKLVERLFKPESLTP